MKAVGGKPFYGDAIGILMLDNRTYPKIPGDVGNATSYDFPVRIRVVPDLNNNPFPPIRSENGDLTSEVQKVVDAVKSIKDTQDPNSPKEVSRAAIKAELGAESWEQRNLVDNALNRAVEGGLLWTTQIGDSFEIGN